MANVPHSAFVEATLPPPPPPNIHKRKATPEQSTAIKKPFYGGFDGSQNDGGQVPYSGSHHGRGKPEPKTQAKQPIPQVQ